MGDSKTSMFYAFAVFIIIYFIGVGIYLAARAIKKMRRK